MKSFKELIVWQESNKFALKIYKLTQLFPKSELFGLVSQLRRAVVSVPANIAEGFNRQSKKEYIQFLYIARGSLQEADSLLSFAKNLSYISEEDYLSLQKDLTLTGRLLSGLINSIKEK